jgi:hypothetical protein
MDYAVSSWRCGTVKHPKKALVYFDSDSQFSVIATAKFREKNGLLCIGDVIKVPEGQGKNLVVHTAEVVALAGKFLNRLRYRCMKTKLF